MNQTNFMQTQIHCDYCHKDFWPRFEDVHICTTTTAKLPICKKCSAIKKALGEANKILCQCDCHKSGLLSCMSCKCLTKKLEENSRKQEACQCEFHTLMYKSPLLGGEEVK